MPTRAAWPVVNLKTVIFMLAAFAAVSLSVCALGYWSYRHGRTFPWEVAAVLVCVPKKKDV